jgi:SH3-like domain-containing protein
MKPVSKSVSKSALRSQKYNQKYKIKLKSDPDRHEKVIATQKKYIALTREKESKRFCRFE